MQVRQNLFNKFTLKLKKDKYEHLIVLNFLRNSLILSKIRFFFKIILALLILAALSQLALNL